MIAGNKQNDDNKDENDITVDANVDADPLDMGIPPPIEVVTVIGSGSSRRGRPRIIDPIEKEFICDICNAKFNKKWKIETHLEGHSIERKYYCETCGEGYSRKRSLWQHISRKHPKSSI